MELSRHILLGLAIFGLPLGLAAAADPTPPPAVSPAVSDAAKAPPSVAPASVAPPVITDTSPADTASTGDGSTRAGVIGGVGLYILQPYFSSNLAYATSTKAGTGPGSLTDTRVDISHHMEVAPQIWLGYMGENGLGFRARWWYFREGSDQSVAAGQGSSSPTIYSAAPLGLSLISGQSMEVTSKLELQVADLEALDEFTVGRWNILMTGGLRLAQMNQTYNAFVPRSFQSNLLSSDAFQGVGPTLALEIRHELGCTGLSLYGNARGSVVFGSAHQSAVQPDQNAGAEDHRDVGMPIGELELGLEYSQTVGRARWFGQVALVGQEWFGAGSASRSSLNVLPGGAFNGASYTGDSDIDFLGLSIRLGLNY